MKSQTDLEIEVLHLLMAMSLHPESSRGVLSALVEEKAKLAAEIKRLRAEHEALLDEVLE